MALTNDQAAKIKEQLISQLSNFPEDKRESMKSQISNLSSEELESFLEQNNLNSDQAKCLFCSIAAKESPSALLGESSENVAILEINPLSKGHTLILPKAHNEKTPESSKEFAKIISKRLQEKFNPKEIRIGELNPMGHGVLELIPIYGDETEKKSASPEELKKVQEEFLQESSQKAPTQNTPKSSHSLEETPKFKPRMP